jgi:iron complex outermembrane receptor protein
LCLCAVLAFVSLPAAAQPAADEGAVVVTATRFPEDARRLPANVTVLGAEEIARSAARTLPELLAEQVGITLKDFFGNNAATTSIDLRGFGVTGPQNTLVLLDGRRITDLDLTTVQWSAIPLASIERIEILRGVGAVLYGDGATSGVINIVTRSPLKRGARLEAFGRAASFGASEGQLVAAHGADSFGVSASLHGFAADGYRANNRNEQQNVNANLRWDLGDSTLDLRFGTDKQDLRLPGARRIQPSTRLDEYAADPRGAQTPLDYASRDGLRAGASLMHRLGDAELSLGIDWRDKVQRSNFDQAGFPIYRADRLEVSSLTPRVRMPFALGGLRHRLTLGADWHFWRYDSRRTNRPENLGQPINKVRAAQDTRGFYLQDRVALAPATELVLGWRSERARYDAQDTVDRGAPGFAFNTAAPPAGETQRRRAWEVGLRHAISPAWTAYARAGRSFRFVNVDEIYETDAAFAAQFQILRPQRATTREAGAEWRVGARSIRAAAFVTGVRDEIHLDPFSTGVGNTNLPPSRRRGIEIDAGWQPASVLRLSAGYALTEAKFREGTLPGSAFAIGTNLPIGGKKVPLVPEHKLNLGFAWEIAAATRLTGALAYVGRQFMDNDEPNTLGVRIPAYRVVDLKLARDFRALRIGLAVNNLFNEKYYNYAVRSAFTADRYSVYPLPGRTVSISLEAKLE